MAGKKEKKFHQIQLSLYMTKMFGKLYFHYHSKDHLCHKAGCCPQQGANALGVGTQNSSTS